MMHAINPENHDRRAAHEPDQIQARWVLWFGAGLVAVLVVTVLGIDATLSRWQRSQPRGEAVSGIDAATAPQLNPDQALELHRLRQRDESRLQGYGWVDQPAGIAHIPIERAIEIISDRGLNTVPSEEGQHVD